MFYEINYVLCSGCHLQTDDPEIRGILVSGLYLPAYLPTYEQTHPTTFPRSI